VDKGFATVLNRVLKKNTKLVCLDLSHNCIAGYLEEMLDGLKNNTSLTILNLEGHLVLSQNYKNLKNLYRQLF